MITLIIDVIYATFSAELSTGVAHRPGLLSNIVTDVVDSAAENVLRYRNTRSVWETGVSLIDIRTGESRVYPGYDRTSSSSTGPVDNFPQAVENRFKPVGNLGR